MAAAAPALPRRSSKSVPLPSWTDGSSAEFLHWLPIPTTFFEHAFRKLTGLEAHVLGLIARYTYGDDRAGRPEWFELSLQKFAVLTNSHKNGVALAIDRLERAGAIDSERVGRGKRYRVAVHRLDKLKDLPKEEAAPEEPEEDGEASESTSITKAPEEPVIRMGKHSVPLKSIAFCRDCAAKIVAAVTPPTPDAEKANEPRMIGTVQCDNQTEKANTGRTIVPVECDDHVEADIEALETHLARRFAKKLGEAPPRRIVEQAIFDLRKHHTPLPDLLNRIEARKGVFNSWAFLGNLTADVINAHAAALRALPQATSKESLPVEPGLSMAERIRAHAASRIAEVEQIEGAGKAVESLIWINQHAAELADQLTKLHDLLEAAEIVVADALKTKLRRLDLNAIHADAAAIVGPRKSKLAPDVYAYEVARYCAPQILKAAGFRWRIAWTT